MILYFIMTKFCFSSNNKMLMTLLLIMIQVNNEQPNNELLGKKHLYSPLNKK